MTDESIAPEQEEKDFSGAFDQAAAKQSNEPVPEPEPDPEKEAKPPEAEPTDPYAGLDEATIEQVKAIEAERDDWRHKYTSNDGRVSAMQHKINDLSAALDEARTPDKKPTEEEIVGAMATDETWEGFKEEYPEVATAIDARLTTERAGVDERINERIEQVEETIEPLAEKAAQDTEEAVHTTLEEHYPGWVETVNTQEFLAWRANQSPGVQALADSDKIADAEAMFGIYENHLKSNDQEWPGKAAAPEKESGASGKVADIKAKRERQLEDGETVANRGAGVTADGPADEFEAAFDAHAARLRRQQA